jgi:hypothetical protein
MTHDCTTDVLYPCTHIARQKLAACWYARGLLMEAVPAVAAHMNTSFGRVRFRQRAWW